MSLNYISDLYRNRENRAFNIVAEILDRKLSQQEYADVTQKISEALKPASIEEVLTLLDAEKVTTTVLREKLERTVNRLIADGLYTTNQVKLLVWDEEYRELIKSGEAT